MKKFLGRIPFLAHPLAEAESALRHDPTPSQIIIRTLSYRAHHYWAEGFRDGFSWWMNHPDQHEAFVLEYLKRHPELLRQEGSRDG